MLRKTSVFLIVLFLLSSLPFLVSAEEEIIKINEGVSYSVVENGVRNDNGVSTKRVNGILEIPGYGKLSVNYKYRRIGILRFNLENCKDEILAADGVYLSIGCNDNYDGGPSVGNDTEYGFLDIVKKEMTIGVYGVSNLNDTWIYGSSRSEMLKSGTDFEKTLLTVMDGDNIEKIQSTSSYNSHYWGHRLCSDDVNFMNYIKDKLRNGEYVVDILFEVDDIKVNPDTYQAFTIVASSTTTYTSNYIEPFKSAIRWYQKKKSDVNTLESVEIENGILNEKFDKNANDYTVSDENVPENEYKKFQKTYNVAVFDTDKDTRLSFIKTSALSNVTGEILSGRIGDVLKIPVVSESGITRTYIFNLVSAEDAGYTENGKLEVEKFVYENDVFESGKLINMRANLKNNSTKAKEVARISYFIKNNTLYNGFVKIYDDVLPGFYPEIVAGVNAEESDTVVSYFSDITDKTNNLSFFVPVGNVISLSSKQPAVYDKKENTIDYYYKDISVPEITVSGKLNYNNSDFICYITKSDYDISDFDCRTDSITDKFTYINAVTTDENGYYGFNAVISETGNYKIGIIDKDGNKTEKEFYFASPSDKDDALKILNSVNTAEELKNELLLTAEESEREEKVESGEAEYNYVKLLALSTDEFKTEINEDSFLNVFFNMIKNSDNYLEIPELYTKAITLEKLNSGKISDIAAHKEVFNLSADMLKIYDDIESQKEDISKNKMSGKNFMSVDDVEPVFRTEVLLKGVSYLDNIEQLGQIIADYSDELTLTDSMHMYTVLNPVAKKECIDGLDAYSPYNSTNDLKSAFAGIVASVYSRTMSNPVAPGGGGGGGGGSSAGNGPSENIGVSGIDNNKGLYSDIINNEKISPFKDIEDFDWAEDAINSLYEKGIINGICNDQFNPSGNVKREEFVKLTSSLYEAEETAVSFSDISENAWYMPFIKKAVSAEVVKGISKNEFGLGLGITREDVAVIICRILNTDESSADARFADDSSISDYARNSVYTLKALGIINGDENGNFNPKKIMTRAEAAVVVCNVLKLSH